MTSEKIAVYLETSALLRSLLEGDAVLERRLEDCLPAIATRLTWLEADRAVRRALASGRIDGGVAVLAHERIASVKVRCHLVSLGDELFVRAARDFPVEPVRALDALHVGAAVFLREALDVDTVASCDERVRSNARALGFKLVP